MFCIGALSQWGSERFLGNECNAMRRYAFCSVNHLAGWAMKKRPNADKGSEREQALSFTDRGLP